MKTCDRCENYFILGINGGTVVNEDGTEELLCNYCKNEGV